MEAAVLEKVNEPLTVADVELGSLSEGQVLVRMRVSGICGAQLQEIAGYKGNEKFMPHLLGHEGCGVVEEVGTGVTTVKKGDKVVLHWRPGEGIESDFPKYIFNGKEISSGKVTTFSEQTIVSENRVTAVPNDLPDDFCALLGCGLSTALGAVLEAGKVQPGETVLVVGLGGLGANIVRAAQVARAGKVVAIDIHDDKKEAADVLGADIFINVAKENIHDALERELGSGEVDVIFETSGNKKATEDTLPLLAGGGRYIFVGQPKPGESIELKNAKHLFDGEGKTIRATQGGGFVPQRDIPKYIEMYKDGVLNIENLITHRVNLGDINDAIQLMREGKANRIMIDICQQ